MELAREGLSIAEVSYENGVITATELNDARLSLLETEWELMQAKYRTDRRRGTDPLRGGPVTRRRLRPPGHRVTETQTFKRNY